MMYSIHHSVGPPKRLPKIMAAGGAKSSRAVETLASVFGECGTDFLEDCPRGCFWIGSCNNRPADHQIVRSGANRFSWSSYPRLIIGFPPSLGSGASCN